MKKLNATDIENPLVKDIEVSEIDERWEASRNGWEKFHGINKVYEKLKVQFERGTAQENEGLNLLLTQGVDEMFNRFSNVALNFAITSALFLSAELSCFANPPPAIISYGSVATWLFFFDEWNCDHFSYDMLNFVYPYSQLVGKNA